MALFPVTPTGYWAKWRNYPDLHGFLSAIGMVGLLGLLGYFPPSRDIFASHITAGAMMSFALIVMALNSMSPYWRFDERNPRALKRVGIVYMAVYFGLVMAIITPNAGRIEFFILLIVSGGGFAVAMAWIGSRPKAPVIEPDYLPLSKFDGSKGRARFWPAVVVLSIVIPALLGAVDVAEYLGAISLALVPQLRRVDPDRQLRWLARVTKVLWWLGFLGLGSGGAAILISG